MTDRIFPIKPAFLLKSFTLSLLMALYMPVVPAIVCLLSAVSAFFIFPGKYINPILGGIAGGVLIHLGLLMLYSSAGSGLPLSEIDRAIIELTDDSFLSGSGNTVLRGKIISVESAVAVECSARGRVLVIAGKGKGPFFKGQRLSMHISLEPMEDSNEFPFIAFARGDIQSLGWTHPLFHIRRDFIALIDRGASRMPDETASLFSALFRGNGDRLDRSFKKQFSLSGVPHLLALSGFHVAIVVALMTGFLRKFIGKKVAYGVVLPFLFIYLFIAGFSPSLVRAVIMFSLAAMFRLLNREISILSLLLITCLIQTILSPLQSLSLSFQLSYLALGGILILAGRIRFLLEPWIPDFLLIPFSASIAAHIATAPLLLIQMGKLYPIGIIASLIVTPLIVLFMWISMFTFVVAGLGCPVYFCKPLFKITGELVKLTKISTGLFSRFPPLSLSSPVAAILYLSLLLLVVLLLYGRGTRTQFKLRFSIGDTGFARNYGTRTPEKVESEFSH